MTTTTNNNNNNNNTNNGGNDLLVDRECNDSNHDYDDDDDEEKFRHDVNDAAAAAEDDGSEDSNANDSIYSNNDPCRNDHLKVPIHQQQKHDHNNMLIVDAFDNDDDEESLHEMTSILLNRSSDEISKTVKSEQINVEDITHETRITIENDDDDDDDDNDNDDDDDNDNDINTNNNHGNEQQQRRKEDDEVSVGSWQTFGRLRVKTSFPPSSKAKHHNVTTTTSGLLQNDCMEEKNEYNNTTCTHQDNDCDYDSACLANNNMNNNNNKEEEEEYLRLQYTKKNDLGAPALLMRAAIQKQEQLLGQENRENNSSSKPTTLSSSSSSSPQNETSMKNSIEGFGSQDQPPPQSNEINPENSASYNKNITDNSSSKYTGIGGLWHSIQLRRIRARHEFDPFSLTKEELDILKEDIERRFDDKQSMQTVIGTSTTNIASSSNSKNGAVGGGGGSAQTSSRSLLDHLQAAILAPEAYSAYADRLIEEEDGYDNMGVYQNVALAGEDDIDHALTEKEMKPMKMDGDELTWSDVADSLVDPEGYTIDEELFMEDVDPLGYYKGVALQGDDGGDNITDSKNDRIKPNDTQEKNMYPEVPGLKEKISSLESLLSNKEQECEMWKNKAVDLEVKLMEFMQQMS